MLWYAEIIVDTCSFYGLVNSCLCYGVVEIICRSLRDHKCYLLVAVFSAATAVIIVDLTEYMSKRIIDT